jgi:hypothetical protein
MDDGGSKGGREVLRTSCPSREGKRKAPEAPPAAWAIRAGCMKTMHRGWYAYRGRRLTHREYGTLAAFGTLAGDTGVSAYP